MSSSCNEGDEWHLQKYNSTCSDECHAVRQLPEPEYREKVKELELKKAVSGEKQKTYRPFIK